MKPGNSPCRMTFYKAVTFDCIVKSRNLPSYVIPAKAGIQSFKLVLDSRFHGSDDFETFYVSVTLTLFFSLPLFCAIFRAFP